MNIIHLLKKIITTKKILKTSGRIAHTFLPENRATKLDNLFSLRKFMRVSASFLPNHQLYIRSKYISSINPFKAISIATS